MKNLSFDRESLGYNLLRQIKKNQEYYISILIKMMMISPMGGEAKPKQSSAPEKKCLP